MYMSVQNTFSAIAQKQNRSKSIGLHLSRFITNLFYRHKNNAQLMKYDNTPHYPRMHHNTWPQVRVFQKYLFFKFKNALWLIPFKNIVWPTKKKFRAIAHHLRVSQVQWNIQRKFWKIQRKNDESGYFSFWP